MRFQSIASGSRGNCIYAGTDNTHLLVDVGISRKRTVDALHRLQLDLSDIDGILLTHEHSDHIDGLKMIAKQSHMPVYATAGTIRAIMEMPAYDHIDRERFIPISADTPFCVKDMEINPIKISHDAAEPVGYRLQNGSRKACVCTDLGCYTEYTADCLRDSDVLLLEANHDVNMVQTGSYPYSLKQRILGDRGHLSNVSSGRLLKEVLNEHMRGILLGHLSNENNFPELAFETVRVELMEQLPGWKISDLPLEVASRNEVSTLLEW